MHPYIPISFRRAGWRWPLRALNWGRITGLALCLASAASVVTLAVWAVR